MTLKHDAQGFLIGEPLDIGRALKVWEDIRKDVRAIRRALGGDASAAPRLAHSVTRAVNEVVARPAASAAMKSGNTNPIPVQMRKPATPQAGVSSENATRRDVQVAQVVKATGQAVTATRAATRATQRAVAKPASRDQRGRFVRGEGRGAEAKDAPSEAEDATKLRGVINRIASAVVDSSASMEEADPAVKAFSEVAKPLARGYAALSGGREDKKQTSFLRRIFSALNFFRKEESAYNKAANKILKNIEEKPVAQIEGGGGWLGKIGERLKEMLGLGAAGTAGALLGKAGRGLMGAGGGAAKAGRGLGGKLMGWGRSILRRIPLIGALLSGTGAALDVYDAEADEKLSRREKDKKGGQAVGGFAGSIAGAFAGATTGGGDRDGPWRPYWNGYWQCRRRRGRGILGRPGWADHRRYCWRLGFGFA